MRSKNVPHIPIKLIVDICTDFIIKVKGIYSQSVTTYKRNLAGERGQDSFTLKFSCLQHFNELKHKPGYKIIIIT